ncbi:polysialyltransferase family glycosyltransferase [Vibrio pelagius]|uniref:polysialyltransferase family glycosyltransferase n=1 Tax=Vibrio pelagius TaxID=28169 RepID=UPI00354E6837
MNVFLVTSPFQYICANEARIAYQTTQNVLVLIEQDNPTGQRQMAALLNESDWQHVIRFPRNKRTSITPKIIKQIKSLSQGQLDTLFYSEYFAWRSKLLIRNLPFEKHVFFDDGTMTFFDYYDYIEPKAEYYRPRWLQDFQLRLKGIQPIGHLGYFDNTEIFSIFHFENCITTLRENNLAVLRDKINQYSGSTRSQNVFIGQGSVDESGRISLSEYLDLIRSAITPNQQEPLLYIPHRTEADHVTEQVKTLEGIQYHVPDFPIEIELMKAQIKPSTIIGLSSTALYTLSKIYPEANIQLIAPTTVAQGERDKRIANYLNDYFASR